MATQKPISTISYNSTAFLKEKLDTWLSSHIIQAYQFIWHKGEDGDKDHIHLRIEPNKVLDPMDLQEQLNEYVRGSDKPLGCRPFRPSKEEDWILYSVHDEQYLALKYNGGEKGEKLPYHWQDIIVPDNYDMEIAFIRAKSYLEHTSQSIIHRLQKGDSAISLALQGENPYIINQALRLLQTSDYQRAVKDCQDMQLRFERLCSLVSRAGFDIVFDDDNFPISLDKSGDD